MSVILMEKNGQGSSRKSTCHINIRYFFITNRVWSKEISIEYCPTDDMIAYFSLKPFSDPILFFKILF